MQGDSYVYRQILVKSISLVSWEELSWRKVPVFFYGWDGYAGIMHVSVLCQGLLLTPNTPLLL